MTIAWNTIHSYYCRFATHNINAPLSPSPSQSSSCDAEGRCRRVSSSDPLEQEPAQKQKQKQKQKSRRTPRKPIRETWALSNLQQRDRSKRKEGYRGGCPTERTRRADVKKVKQQAQSAELYTKKVAAEE